MDQFIQILLLVTVVYLTLTVAVRSMLGEHTRLVAIMATILFASIIILVQHLS
jgi:hypothetical protein